MVFSCLKKGFTLLLSNKRMLVTFYLVNLLFAIVLMIPFRSGLASYLGNSKAAIGLASGIDFPLMREFFQANASMLPAMILLFALVAILYWLANLFLSGGAFSVFALRDNYNSDSFWAGCGRFFGRFFRLALMFVPLAAILLLSDALLGAIPKLFYGDDVPGSVAYWMSGVRVFWRGFLLVVAFVVFDYARIYMVLTNSPKARTALKRGAGFVLSNFRRTVTLGFAFYLLSVLLILGYAPIADVLNAPSALVVILLILLHQLYMLVRMSFRLALYGGEVEMYKRLGGETAPAEPYIDDIPSGPSYAGSDSDLPTSTA